MENSILKKISKFIINQRMLVMIVFAAALLTVSFDGDETERFPTEYDALIEALAKSIVEISSSSLTTIAGLVALMLMQFRLGYDLGLVLSKSIVCSLITVFLLMPGLIAYCRKPLRATARSMS